MDTQTPTRDGTVLLSPADAARLAKVSRDTICREIDRGELAAHHGVRHTRTRPGRPRTNGKAERFIQTLLNEWAYARLYGSSQERRTQLTPYLERYNFRRPHGPLAKQPPATRLTNLVGNYT